MLETHDQVAGSKPQVYIHQRKTAPFCNKVEDPGIKQVDGAESNLYGIMNFACLPDFSRGIILPAAQAIFPVKKKFP